MKQISNRAAQEKSSPIRELVDIAHRRQKEGVKPFFLNIGQPFIKAPDLYLDYLKTFPSHMLPYSHAKGDLNLRKAWAGYYQRRGQEVTFEDLLITIGASEALTMAFSVVADPNEEVLCLSPFYPNYKSFAKQTGVRLCTIERESGNRFHLPPIEEIEKRITPKTRAILFSNPCNPTGVVFHKEELEALVDFCEKYDLFIISDEVYHEIAFKEKATSLLDFPKAASRVIVVDSVSKKFSLCGARIGALFSKNPRIIEAVSGYGSARLSAPTLEQQALVPVFEKAEQIIPSYVDEFFNRKEVVFKQLSSVKGVEVHDPEGGIYVFCTLPVPSSSKFCHWLADEYSFENQTLILAPGYGFYGDSTGGDTKVRIANVLNKENLNLALEVLKNGVKEYPLSSY